MQQPQDGAEHERPGRPRLLRRRAAGGKHRLGKLQEPVAERPPGKPVAGRRILIEAKRLQRCGRLCRRRVQPVQQPSAQRRGHRIGLEHRPDLPGGRAVHLQQPRRVPQLGDEAAISLHPLRAELHVPPRAGQRADGEAQCVGPKAVDQRQRVDDVAAGLAHLLPAFVTHQAMDHDLAERHVAAEVQPHHQHPGHPEEDDVEPGHQHVAGIVARQLGRRLGPS